MAAGKIDDDVMILVIDTTSYAGNFERQMCAFMTGQVGECGVGDEFIDEVIEDLSKIFVLPGLNADDHFTVNDWIEDNISNQPDDSDYPCYRPCSIWETPGWYNNGMGGHYKVGEGNSKYQYPAYLSVAIFFETEPPQEVIDVLVERAKRFAKERPDHKSYLGEKKELEITNIRLLKPKLTEKIVKTLQLDGYHETSFLKE